ncbi:LacI family DNA-binding transcriptional regulator [Bacillus sp. CGMCC 1.16607]|uniref:LacI family DNA-binding transcriptional regulator n=1 Tax=Bacillus sp. CGMCC 1.16607 TaxID=3351842 RepID=UPI00362A26C5
MGVSIKDVAKKSGLSTSTVSRVLNNQYGVSQKTKHLVLKAVEELGYVPNLQARELVNKKSNLVGLIIPETDFEARPAFFEILPYLNQTISLYQKEIIISAVTPIPRRYQDNQLETFLKKRNLEGCIILPGFISDHPIYKEARNTHYPIVVVGENSYSNTCSSIKVNDEKGAQIATNFFIENGHREIGFVNGPSHASICIERLTGYKKALSDANIPWNQERIIESDFTGEGGARSAEKLLDSFPSLTAIFFANDIMAIGAISALSKRGVNIPETISIIGYDGIFLTKYTNPPLTTIELESSLMGTKIGELLIRMTNGGVGKRKYLTPKLTIRSTVKNISGFK